MFIENFLPTVRQRMCCIDAGTTLLQAARLLESDYSMLVVCDAQGRMAGVLTKSDAVRQLGICTDASCISPVSDAMTPHVTTAAPKGQLKDAWDLMKKHGLKNIPVIGADGKPIGVLNARDVLQNLWQEVQQEEGLLYDYVMSVGYQ